MSVNKNMKTLNIDWTTVWKTFDKFCDINDVQGEWRFQAPFLMLALNLNLSPRKRLSQYTFEKANTRFKNRTRKHVPDWPVQKRILREELEYEIRRYMM